MPQPKSGRCGCMTGKMRGDICYCPIEGIVDVISRKYALPLIALIGNHKQIRFGDIARHFTGISQKTLTDRLKEFQEAGLVSRKSYSEIPPRVEYSLTAMGANLREAIKPLMAWASKSDQRNK